MRLITAILTLAVATTASAYDGLRPGEREMLDRANERDADQRDYKRYRYERDNANHVGYADRNKIKNLEYRKRQLNDQLRNARTPSERYTIETQIIGLDRQIEQINAPKW